MSTEVISRLSFEREIMDSLVNDETHFFRNFVAFKHLRISRSPNSRDARRSDEPLRLWCAGASSGQEPYSISIMYHEAMPALKKIGLEIWATDISQTLVNRGIAGRYSTQEVSRHVPDKIIRNHFRRKKGVADRPTASGDSQIPQTESSRRLERPT